MRRIARAPFSGSIIPPRLRNFVAEFLGLGTGLDDTLGVLALG
jgi:hypothetical protein